MHILLLVQSYVTARIDDPRLGAKFKIHLQEYARSGMKTGLIAVYQRGYTAADVLRNKGFLFRDQDHACPVIRDTLFDTLLRRLPKMEIFRRRSTLSLRAANAYIHDFGRPDIIHAHGATWAGLAAMHIREKLGIPYVLTEHMSVVPRGEFHPGDLPLIKAIYRNASHVMPVSNNTGMDLEKSVGNTCRPWTAVSNMADPAFLVAPPSPLPSSPPVLFYAGRLAPVKGTDILLEAFAKLGEAGGAILRIGGDGPLRSEYERAAAHLGIRDRVEFLGYLTRAEVLAHMCKATACILPSRYETFGIPAIEAAACGRPVIATRCGGPDEIIEEATGLLVPPEDAQALSRAMRELLDNPQRYSPDQIRARCLERYSPQAIVDQYRSCYRRALADAPER